MADDSPTPTVITRKEAKARGLLRYFTGAPCKRGHIAERHVMNKTCAACDLARHLGDPGHAARCRQRYQAKRAEHLAQVKAYQAANADTIRAKKAAHRAIHRDRINAKIAEWAKANPEKRRAKERAREGRERGATGSHTYADIMAIGEAQGWRCIGRCAGTSIRTAFHVDHVLPIALGGTNEASNIQLLCGPCNLSKGAKHPADWLRCPDQPSKDVSRNLLL